jgi:hypothetical protein
MVVRSLWSARHAVAIGIHERWTVAKAWGDVKHVVWNIACAASRVAVQVRDISARDAGLLVNESGTVAGAGWRVKYFAFDYALAVVIRDVQKGVASAQHTVAA